MKFAVFDHMDRGTVSLQQQFSDRLRLAEAYEEAGFHAYHVAEHHSTPLGVASSPSVYLAALSQRTSRLRFGTLVYALSMHHPLRVLEEICMLDNMSNGRMEMGFGRGISPYELAFYGVDPKQAQSLYQEAFKVIMAGLTSSEINFSGRHFRFENVPVVLQPVQKPTPPLWYGLGNIAATEWAAENRCNVVCNGTSEAVRAITDKFRACWKQLGRGLDELPHIGVSRHVVVAETDEKAMAIAAAPYERWRRSLLHLWIKNGTDPGLPFPETFEEAHRAGLAIAGSPDTVRRQVEATVEACGVNYLVCRMAFGDLAYEDSLKSAKLFGREVISALASR